MLFVCLHVCLLLCVIWYATVSCFFWCSHLLVIMNLIKTFAKFGGVSGIQEKLRSKVILKSFCEKLFQPEGKTNEGVSRHREHISEFKVKLNALGNQGVSIVTGEYPHQ